MLTLSPHALSQLTGAELLDLLRHRPRQGADLEVGGQEWRVYTSTHRGSHHGICFHLWAGRTHILGDIQQRIGEMRQAR